MTLTDILTRKDCRVNPIFFICGPEGLKIGEKGGSFYRLEHGLYRSWMCPMAAPMEERENPHFPRKSPDGLLRVLHRNLRNKKLSAQKRRKMIEKACEAFMEQKNQGFGILARELLENKDPHYFDVANSLVGLARGYGLKGDAHRLSSHVFREDRKEGNREIYTL